MNRGRRAFCFGLAALLWAASVTVLNAQDGTAAFEQANKFYEQGKFSEAASAYEKLAADGRVSAELLFNWGNALFKSGQIGRAIVAYRRAGVLSPRDPDLRANLQFARNSVTGGAGARSDRWRRWLDRLTLNEWTAIAAIAAWVWLGLLTLAQVWPAWKTSLRGCTAAASVAACLAGFFLGATWYEHCRVIPAVVVARETVVRYGPLDESQSHYNLQDGAEVTVLDRNKDWLQVADAAKRIGWLRGEQVVVLSPAGQPFLH